jgi:hypothetical protein
MGSAPIFDTDSMPQIRSLEFPGAITGLVGLREKPSQNPKAAPSGRKALRAFVKPGKASRHEEVDGESGIHP